MTPAEMAAIDAEAPEPVAELIERAGWATARAALGMLERPYGSRVAVLAGKGNNGADGRAAVRHLERAGARCTVFDVGPRGDGPGPVDGARFDLVIDACFGTGLRDRFDADALPVAVGDTPVLAVDIPSGIDGATGQAWGTPLAATSTVTFAALKPGLLLDPGRRLTGPVTVADIGLDCSRATMHHLEPDDLRRWPVRRPDDHKWRRALVVVGGGPGMGGAPRLAAQGAFRAGAGYVALSIPGSRSSSSGPGGPPMEAVEYPIGRQWADDLGGRIERFAAAVVGPGLGEGNGPEVGRWWATSSLPTVFDAGALTALADIWDRAAVGPSPAPTTHVLTPHDGEFARLTGQPPGPDRVAAARALAARTGAVVLLKGPTTVVAQPDQRVLLSTAGDARLATAGTGDVLSGIIGAGLAAGLDPFLSAGLGAELHGRAATSGPAVGLVASDLPSLVAQLLTDATGRV